ncbi:MAG: glycosyl transferase [Acidobacteriota bacterium]
MIHVFTSSAPNYVGKVRALCESLQEHCPDMMVHWLVAETRNDALLEALADDPIDNVIFLDDFETYRDPGWLFQHDIVELSTAIKPGVALSLLEREDCELLIYFDPDQVVFSPLDDLVEALRSASAVLTPHLLVPYEDLKAVRDHEICALRNGIFNLGFFGVRDCEEGRAFLSWWSDRCLDFCWGDWRSGVFTDQKWINHAPVFFPEIATLRSPRFNVAPWNINQRNFEGSFDEGFKVEGEDLGFYHFTGFDSGAHQEVIDWYAAGNKAVHGLVQWYKERTHSLLPDMDLSWRLGKYSNGQKVMAPHRKIYRQREDLQAAFPDPFAANGGDELTYLKWIETAGPVEFPEELGGQE